MENSSETTQVLYPFGVWEEADPTCDCRATPEFWGWVLLTSGSILVTFALVAVVFILT